MKTLSSPLGGRPVWFTHDLRDHVAEADRTSFAADGSWVPFAPKATVFHYGGGAHPYRIVAVAEWLRLLSGWTRYHRSSKGMRTFAYNFSIGPRGRRARGRGWNQNGAHSNSNVWGKNTFTVVVPIAYREPASGSIKRNAAEFLLETPMPVMAHKNVPDQATTCCGVGEPADFYWWVRTEGWRTQLAPQHRWKRSRTVRSLKRRLAADGWWDGPYGRGFGGKFARAVKKWQQANGLASTGRVGQAEYDVLFSSVRFDPSVLR